MVKDTLSGREVIIEYHPVGNIVKVSAMDVASLTEVSIQGPSNTPEQILKNNAIRRLEYVLKKNGVIT